MKLRQCALLCLLNISIGFFAQAMPADTLPICYNYDCAVRSSFQIDTDDQASLFNLFRNVTSPQHERQMVSLAIGLMQRIAAKQTPTGIDKGENWNDDALDGRMDCLDHSENSTTYIQYFIQKGWIKYHRSLERIMRAPLIFNTHWAAIIEEIETHEKYAVDSWFFDNGNPAVVLRLKAWKSGEGPRTQQ